MTNALGVRLANGRQQQVSLRTKTAVVVVLSAQNLVNSDWVLLNSVKFVASTNFKTKSAKRFAKDVPMTN